MIVFLAARHSLLFARRYKVVEHGSRSQNPTKCGPLWPRANQALSQEFPQCRRFTSPSASGFCSSRARWHLALCPYAACYVVFIWVASVALGLALRNGWARGIAWDAGYLVNQHQAAGVSRSPVWCLLSTHCGRFKPTFPLGAFSG